MSSFFTTIIIGISLSMDAFSLALIYGTLNLSSKQKIELAIIVGIYHFIMPLLGLLFGNIIYSFIPYSLNIIVGLIFILIGLEMIISSLKEKEKPYLIGLTGFLIFGFSVSIDSFTTGIGLKIINNNFFEVGLTFQVISSILTYLGLNIGNILHKKVGIYSTILGGIILIALGVIFFLGKIWHNAKKVL